jgi:hypothetical protein
VEALKIKDRIVGLERVSATDIREHPKNWRLHPANQRSALEDVLETIGVADAVIAYHSERHDGQLTLIDGHLRRDILEEVPVLVTDLNDEEADALLAAHDVVTLMAQPDNDAFEDLLDDVAEVLPEDLLLILDRGGRDADVPASGENPKFPITPELDESYDCVLIFSMRDSDFAWLETVLELPQKDDGGRIGVTRVLTVPEFRERWDRHKRKK